MVDQVHWRSLYGLVRAGVSTCALFEYIGKHHRLCCKKIRTLSHFEISLDLCRINWKELKSTFSDMTWSLFSVTLIKFMHLKFLDKLCNTITMFQEQQLCFSKIKWFESFLPARRLLGHSHPATIIPDTTYRAQNGNTVWVWPKILENLLFHENFCPIWRLFELEGTGRV